MKRISLPLLSVVLMMAAAGLRAAVPPITTIPRDLPGCFAAAAEHKELSGYQRAAGGGADDGAGVVVNTGNGKLPSYGGQLGTGRSGPG
jgi:hypothetical protein